MGLHTHGKSKVCQDILAALGLKDKAVKSLDLRIAVGEVTSVKIEYFADERELENIPGIMKDYYLCEKDKN